MSETDAAAWQPLTMKPCTRAVDPRLRPRRCASFDVPIQRRRLLLFLTVTAVAGNVGSAAFARVLATST